MWPTAVGFDVEQSKPIEVMEGVASAPSRELGTYGLAERETFDHEVFVRATDFISRQVAAKRPFFAYLPVAFPHFPLRTHARFKGCTGHGDFADGLVELDTRVGELLDTLDALGVGKNTLIVYTSDNGVEETLPTRGWTGPWGGSYFTTMEGCLRVPFIARWPGHIAAGRISKQIVHAVDLFSTLASIGRAPVPNDRPIDGIDMTDFFLGRSDKSGREGFPVYFGNNIHAVKWRDWKMHFIRQEYMFDPPLTLPIPRLHNLLDDPRERHDVFLPGNTWVKVPVQRLMRASNDSLRRHPPILPGTPDPNQPHANSKPGTQK